MEMNDDIVVRLREEGFITHMAKLSRESKILHAAADEIERLRNEIQECENLIDEYQREDADRTRWGNNND